MSTRVHTGLLLSAGLLMTSCALRSGDVPAIGGDAREFSGWSCTQMHREMDAVKRQASRVAYAFDERTGGNIAALGVGLSVFWPALLAMRSASLEAQTLGELKGRHETLRQVLQARACPPDFREAAAHAAATVGPGDRLSYEQRHGARGVAERTSIRLVDMSQARVEWRDAGAADADGATWVNDRMGNLLRAPRGLVWPSLLRTDLTLGALVHGELIDQADPGLRARVRGQVMAIGPQDVGGRRFDAAVIELFGDAPLGEGRTRLDGAMVIDRHSGLLLRLDLESAQPAFRLQRRLVRVERPTP